MSKDQRAVRGERFEFVGCGDERQAGVGGDPLGEQLGELTLGIETGADSRTALRQRVKNDSTAIRSVLIIAIWAA
jgi:hypothetical protein